jgi:hypothetical protein
MWSPAKDAPGDDHLATTGDYLRIWKVSDEGEVKEPPVLLNNNSKSEYCAPLTSFDWNETDPNIIGTSSIDTTCTIWDVEHRHDVHHLGRREGRGDDAAHRARQGGVRHRLRAGEECLRVGGRRRQRPALRPQESRALHHHVSSQVVNRQPRTGERERDKRRGQQRRSGDTIRVGGGVSLLCAFSCVHSAIHILRNLLRPRTNHTKLFPTATPFFLLAGTSPRGTRSCAWLGISRTRTTWRPS